MKDQEIKGPIIGLPGPKQVGQIIMPVFEDGNVLMKVEGEVGPFTVLKALEGMRDSFLQNLVNMEQQQGKVVTPPGVPLPNLRQGRS
jgi:hypothetical protein